MAENYDERPLRFCDGCGQVDRAPRHSYVDVPGNGASDETLIEKALADCKKPEETLAVVRAARDDSLISKHLDCCAEDGCPTGTCQEQLDKAKGKKDADLAKFLAPKEG